MKTLPARVRLGAFEVNLRVGELRSGDRVAILQDQPLQVLRMLIERECELVTREEIKKRFWPNDTVVEFDHSINAAIKKLRRALDDSADEPKYIQTIMRRGYRLIVPVEWIAAEDSAGEANAQIVVEANTVMALQPDTGALTGRTVSHYRVLDIVGGGGMGVVYRAEDLKLGRAVALKFLPEELGGDAAALERFSREARAASSLDHANICAIYEFGEHEGRAFIVMQLLEGQTLRDRLATSLEPLSLEALLDIGIQISDALQAAHDKGIIHRDIKPANIFLTNKGVCKILDFGLAKLLEVGNEDNLAVQPDNPGSALPAASGALHLTRTGSAMGTAGYMSPEQVRGEKLDTRTDLFSFGLVLYEMATGQRAFSGQTAEMVRDAIVHQPQVSVHELNSKLPPELETVINKALEKERQVRYQAATEMGAELRRLQRESERVAKKSPQYQLVLVLAAVLFIVLVAGGMGFRWFRGPTAVPRKALTERLLTHSPSENRLLRAAISPDGKYLAYTDPKGLYFSVIESGEVHEIPLPDELRTHLWDVRWFPDGEKLLFTTDTDGQGTSTWLTSIFGGVPRKLRSDCPWPVVSPDGSLIAFPNGNEDEIWVMGANGENARKILSGEKVRYTALYWSPDGQRVAFIKRAAGQTGGSIGTVPLAGGPPSIVMSSPQLQSDDGPGLLWTPDARILFLLSEGNSANFWAIMTDPLTGKPSGSATKVTNWDGVKPWSSTISSDGKRLAVVKLHIRDDVYIGELKDKATRLASPTRFTVSDSQDNPTGWMHDSKTLLFSSDRTGRDQIFKQQIDRDKPETVITGRDWEDGGVLTPDARWILYWSIAPDRESSPTTQRLMRRPVSGGFPEQVLESRVGEGANSECSIRSSGICVYSHKENGQLIFYGLDPVKGQGKELARTNLEYAHGWSISPDGSRVAVSGSGSRGNGEVHILDLLKGTESNPPLPQGWHIYETSWTADGNALIGAGTSSTGYFIARIELDGRSSVLLDRGRNQALEFPLPSPDGRHLAFRQQTWESNAWLLENF
jgi:Tol biopolymer transport system component/DNA-binding winged helix-turn-helix (wHTH) protein